MSNLKESLKLLPIRVGKVHLWLVHRGFKPMATIVLDFYWGGNLEKQQTMSKWLKDAKVKYKVSQRSGDVLHVSLDQKILDQHSKYELRDDVESHLLKGKWYGFPEEAVAVYARVVAGKDDPFPNDELIHSLHNSTLEKKYWHPYVEYVLRRGYELEDSQVAKRWADLARKEIPELAGSYERKRNDALEKFKKQLIEIYKK